jgi:hypothetical protein
LRSAPSAVADISWADTEIVLPSMVLSTASAELTCPQGLYHILC